MVAHARLTTPNGKTIELSAETYQKIQKLLGADIQSEQRPHIAEIRATYGKYAGKPSLVQTLLEERKAERAREEAKVMRHDG